MQPYWPSLSELCVELILWSASNLQANCKHYTFPNELSIFLLLYGQITSFLEIKSPFTPMAECVDYNLSAAGECFLSFFFFGSKILNGTLVSVGTKAETLSSFVLFNYLHQRCLSSIWKFYLCQCPNLIFTQSVYGFILAITVMFSSIIAFLVNLSVSPVTVTITIWRKMGKSLS